MLLPPPPPPPLLPRGGRRHSLLRSKWRNFWLKIVRFAQINGMILDTVTFVVSLIKLAIMCAASVKLCPVSASRF
eukprot:COSAG02_NODE_818_length_16813_cov_137.642874_4_plen_75_part_00